MKKIVELKLFNQRLLNNSQLKINSSNVRLCEKMAKYYQFCITLINRNTI